MSSNTWTPDALSFNRSLSNHEVWRIVETQYRVSTMKLVNSLDEQSLLEDIIERTKPSIPEDCEKRHFLLYTPFRYPPHPNGSRFRPAGASEGVFYAASSPETAIAEAAFHRLLFFAESPGLPFPKNPNEYTAFCIAISSPAVIDLTRAPYDGSAVVWTHPQNYAPCQQFAEAARKAGAEVLCYSSVRDPHHRSCYAVMRCCAFGTNQPKNLQNWKLLIGKSGVYAYRENPKSGLTIPLAAFQTDDRLLGLEDRIS